MRDFLKVEGGVHKEEKSSRKIDIIYSIYTKESKQFIQKVKRKKEI